MSVQRWFPQPLSRSNCSTHPSPCHLRRSARQTSFLCGDTFAIATTAPLALASPKPASGPQGVLPHSRSICRCFWLLFSTIRSLVCPRRQTRTVQPLPPYVYLFSLRVVGFPITQLTVRALQLPSTLFIVFVTTIFRRSPNHFGLNNGAHCRIVTARVPASNRVPCTRIPAPAPKVSVLCPLPTPLLVVLNLMTSVCCVVPDADRRVVVVAMSTIMS